MRSLFAALGCLSLLSGPVFSQEREISPAVYILNDGAAPQYNYDRDVFLDAARQAGKEVAGLVLASEADAFASAKAKAAEAGGHIVHLSVTNLEGQDSRDLDPAFENLTAQIAAKPVEEGWHELAIAPMCRLYAATPAGQAQVTTAMLAVMDEPNAKLNCYRLALSYFAGAADEEGRRVMPIYMDSRAMTMQATLPPIEVAEAYLALKYEKDARGRFKRRESTVYAPYEEIFLRAYLDHVGRDLAGTMQGSYRIDLSMEVRTPDGELVKSGRLYTYENPSRLFYPLDHTYFWNNITAGVSLDTPGDYVIAFLFEDGSRPAAKPAEVTFPVTISAE